MISPVTTVRVNLRFRSENVNGPGLNLDPRLSEASGAVSHIRLWLERYFHNLLWLALAASDAGSLPSAESHYMQILWHTHSTVSATQYGKRLLDGIRGSGGLRGPPTFLTSCKDCNRFGSVSINSPHSTCAEHTKVTRSPVAEPTGSTMYGFLCNCNSCTTLHCKFIDWHEEHRWVHIWCDLVNS